MDIRPLADGDLEAVIDLRASAWPDDLSTVESMTWDISHTSPEEHTGRWVATGNGRVVGWATAGRATWTTEPLASINVIVQPNARRQGIGGRLFATAQAHLAPLSPIPIRTGTQRGDSASVRFVHKRGFKMARSGQSWSVDPRTVAVDDLDPRRAAAESQGLRLEPVRRLLDRPQALFELTHALESDLPSEVPIGGSYADWQVYELETPLFSPDASFCVLTTDDVPVALTWIRLDLPRRRAAHGMTGTLPAYRHRGLARLVKLASIDWLARAGVAALFTENDMENRDMLALNQHLGYLPLTIFDIWMR